MNDNTILLIPIFQDIPGEVVSKPSFISANIGDAADEAMMYSEQAKQAAFAFSSHHISSKFSLLNPTPLHPSFSKQIPFSFNSNGNSMKSPQHPPVYHSKDEQHPEEQLSNQETEPSMEPLLHHFLSSMSNFAYGGPTASPEPTPKSFANDSKNDNTSDYEDGNEEFYKHKGCNSFSVTDGCADEHSANGEERALEGESKEKPFRCDQCGQCYKYGSAYARHREQDHRARPPAEKPFRCESCGMRFRYLKSFKKHRLNHTLDRLRSKNYSSEEIILEEGNALHRLGKEGASGKDRKAVDCREKNDKDFAVVTEGNESSRRRWPASFPDWKEQDGVESEDNAQVGTIPTSASTSEASQLWELLMRTPQDAANTRENEDESSPKDGTGRPSLDCPFCGKSFRSRENLRLHVRKHTGERPFECSVCGRAFGGKSDMTRHLRIHTGERPYRCHVCTKRFARADYLSKHLTTHLH
ncbi:hypothetical protein J437_LFUL017896 [Ladona fulva]|uniref:C2H2-type domain-containing protein n=1 Tax=Ladona fulva TaxID=123851 RepID=A0A8K0P6W6_LADFU|nr:hypothetical protein J437_LFUL017896 [Ladona fulva]